MWLCPDAALEAGTKRLDFLIWQRGRRAVKPHEMRHSGNLLDLQAVSEGHSHEYVSRKQRHLQCYAPVFPPPHRLIYGQEVFHRAYAELLRDALLVVGAGVCGVPPPLTICCGHYSQIISGFQSRPVTRHDSFFSSAAG